MGQIPKEEIQRNKNLIKDYLAFDSKAKEWKFTLSQLGWKYRRIVGDNEIPLTTTRIYQILAKHGVPRERIPSKNPQQAD